MHCFATHTGRESSHNRVEVVFFEYEDIGYYQLETMIIGWVKVYLEKDNSSKVIKLMGFQEEYYDRQSKQKAENMIIYQIEDILPDECERGDYDSFWEDFDIDKLEWVEIDKDIEHQDVQEGNKMPEKNYTVNEGMLKARHGDIAYTEFIPKTEGKMPCVIMSHGFNSCAKEVYDNPVEPEDIW